MPKKNTRILSEEERKIKMMLDMYKRAIGEKSWEHTLNMVGLSRNCYYELYKEDKEVRRETVILIGISLRMSTSDFFTLYTFNGFCMREFNKRDKLIISYFEGRKYSHRDLNDSLNKNNLKPLYKTLEESNAKRR